MQMGFRTDFYLVINNDLLITSLALFMRRFLRDKSDLVNLYIEYHVRRNQFSLLTRFGKMKNRLNCAMLRVSIIKNSL